ncbi:hypothetical protein [uncultured Cetobacterium sp.]|uniref:hypothetical protein n=1 Tax=uncultured Cetobacterium sp. TaxID=527638 RepID=UPI0026140146|nr:hypothetical protein [uncultured Cetobacterium sp.]
MKKFILNKKLATENKVLCHAVIENEEFITFEGEEVPHFITWDENLQNIRAAKLSELVERGDYIVPEGFKLVGEEIIEMTVDEKKINGIIPLEDNEIIENGSIKTLSDYEMVVVGKKELLPGEYLNHETKELLTKEYPNDGKIYKWENEEWIIDIEKTKALKQELQNKIIELENKKLIYTNKGWDSTDIDTEISELEKQLNLL